jgi:thiosulfate dehydrogenase
MKEAAEGSMSRSRQVGLVAIGFVAALVLLFGGAGVYLRFWHPPVAVADASFPMEAQIVHVPMGARIAREMESPPFEGSEQVYEAGAVVYKTHCSQCHGLPGQDVDYAKWMYPSAPQLFKMHSKSSVVGVSDDEPGETYWKVKNGIRLTGMPAFQHILSTEQMWDVTLLLKSADHPMTEITQEKLKN